MLMLEWIVINSFYKIHFREIFFMLIPIRKNLEIRIQKIRNRQECFIWGSTKLVATSDYSLLSCRLQLCLVVVEARWTTTAVATTTAAATSTTWTPAWRSRTRTMTSYQQERQPPPQPNMLLPNVDLLARENCWECRLYLYIFIWNFVKTV